MLKVEIPWPPARPHLYGQIRHGKCHRKKLYHDYVTSAHAIFKYEKLKTTHKDVFLRLVFYKPKEASDIDDYYDLIIDTLCCKKKQLIHNGKRIHFVDHDSGLVMSKRQIKRFHASQHIEKRDPRIVIYIYDAIDYECVFRKKGGG